MATAAAPLPLARAVGGLGVATIASYGGWFYGFGVLLQPITDDTGWGVPVLGAAYAVAQLLTGLGATVGGRLLDRHGGRPVFAIGGLAGGVLLGLAAIAPSALAFAVAFALAGGLIGSVGFYHVTMAAARRLRPDRPASAIGPLTIYGAFASPIFLPLTAWMVGPLGWRGTLGVLSGTTAAGLVAAAGLAPGGRSAAVGQAPVPLRRAIAQAWEDRATRRLVVMVMGHGIGFGIILAYQVPVMVALGLPLGTAAGVAGARGLLQLTGRIGLGRLVDRHGSRRPLVVVMLASAVAAVLLGGSGTPWVAALFALVAGAAIGAQSPLTGIRAGELLPERHLGALMGAVHAVGGAAAAAGPLLGGLLIGATGGYAAAVGLACGGFLLAAAAIARD